MPSVLHVTHFDPPIHGEAVMAGLLRDSAANWENDPGYHTVNTVFARNRDQLGGLSPRKLFLLARFLIATTIAKFRFRSDILLLHPSFHRGSFLKDSLFIWLGRLLGMKIIAWIHMDPSRIDLDHSPRWFRSYLISTLSHVDHVVACAPSLPETWPDWLKQRPHTGIANAIPDPFEGKFTATPERPPNAPLRVIYLSAMHHEKGWQDLFQAACQICSQRSDVEFHFHGNVAPDEESTLLETFATSGNPDRIQWLGPVSGADKYRRLSQADLFVFPSHTEQFSIAILEAMACGLPIVATDVGAMRDALLTPDGGNLLPARNPDLLAQTVDNCLQQRNKLRAMGNFNRQRFVKHFTPASFATQWCEHFLNGSDRA